MIHREPFKSRKRTRGTVVNVALVHQSVTSSPETTEKVLRRSGYGVHFAIDGDGQIYQYNDPIDKLAHGNEMNGRSVGVEIIQPYTKTKGHWQTMIDPSPTAWRGREASDTKAQIDSLDALCGVLCGHVYEKDGITISIPPELPTTSAGGPSRGSELWFDRSIGGIIAHGHRPGRYPKGHAKEGQRVKGAHADARRTLWLLMKKQEV